MFRLTIHGDDPIARIEPDIYGHFTEHIGGVFYDGIWVGEESPVPNVRGIRTQLVEKMRAIHAPVIRWPGGCFAEIYDWRDGIGPRAERPVRPSWWTVHDGRYETNEVGTHEFVDFCRQCGAEPYFAANITTLRLQDIRDWMDYCNSPAGTTSMARLRERNGSREPLNVKYWGVGNETWGGGGNMTAEMYAHEYRKYAMVMNNTAPDAVLFCSGANHRDWTWACELLKVIESSSRLMDGLSLHFYCGTAGTATGFTEREWYRQLRKALDIEATIERNWGFVVGYGLEKHGRLVIDEWGCWHQGGSGPSAHMREYGIAPAANNPEGVQNLFEQQSTMRDAMVSAATLNVFNNNAEKIRMANAAQLVNNLHCLFLCGGDQFICTPTYHVFDMMQGHQGGTALRVSGCTGSAGEGEDEIPQVSASASVKDGRLTVTLANLSMTQDAEVALRVPGLVPSGEAEYAVLTADDPHAHNTYENPEAVVLRRSSGAFTGSVSVPKFSAVTVTVAVTEEA